MPVLAIYLEKLAIGLSAVWLFYQLLLRRLTFYHWNRWYLLGYSLLAFFIPFVNVERIVEGGPLVTPVVIRYIPVVGTFPPAFDLVASPVYGHPPTLFSAMSPWEWIMALLALGSAILLGRLAGRWLSLRSIRRKARLIAYTAEVKIYQVDEPIVPFSFGDAIYINRDLHTDHEWEQIILHENVHIRQRHTVDILLAELLCILNWYNPFAWLIRHSIRQNLEFIADGKVLGSGFDKKGYQYHLLKVVGEPRYRLAHSFNFSSLKKRIIMMNKMKSARVHLVKFLFVLPLLALLLVAFRDKVGGMLEKKHGPFQINEAGIVSDLVNDKPVAGVRVTEKGSGVFAISDERGFYELRIPVKGDSIRMHLDFSKSGYEPIYFEEARYSVRESFGHVTAAFIGKKDDTVMAVFMEMPYSKKAPLNPGYQDALSAVHESIQENVDVGDYLKMKQAHPEVSLFYTAEGCRRQVVVLASGEVEKYGYAGGPTVADMEKKYCHFPGILKDGHLPKMMIREHGSAGAGYFAAWQKISAAAEKEFHTTNPDVRQIVFPGDSRVIVAPVSGKARFYDMDSKAPEERAAFEKLYGKLPDCVPPPGQRTISNGGKF